MPSTTTAYAKNIIRRAFREIIDPTPSKQEAEAVWNYFARECAYCGKKLLKENKEGHMDHLISASKGGRNSLSNRVLSCANCNEKEKRDLPWEEFLESKVSVQSVLEFRRRKIIDWQQQNSTDADGAFQRFVNSADSLADEVVEYFELKIKQLKVQK